MYNMWINVLIVFNVVMCLAQCSEARAQGLVEARRPFESSPRSTSSFSAERQLELHLKLEEARARASQFPSPLPIPALGSYGYQSAPCVWQMGATCYRNFQILQIGDRIFIQEGYDVTTRQEFRAW